MERLYDGSYVRVSFIINSAEINTESNKTDENTFHMMTSHHAHVKAKVLVSTAGHRIYCLNVVYFQFSLFAFFFVIASLQFSSASSSL